jgi:hypothetical protein
MVEQLNDELVVQQLLSCVLWASERGAWELIETLA